MLGSLIFGYEPNQRIRIQRLLFASTTYLFGVLLVQYCIWMGLMPKLDYRKVISGAVLLNLFFYLVIRFGLNLRTRDPSLTMPQIAVATAVNTYLVYFAGPARGAFLMGYVLILAFAILRLRPLQIMLTGTLVLAIYGVIIIIEYVSRTPNSNFPLELLQWLMLLFVYPWFAMLAGYVASARRKRRDSSAKLAEALRENETVLKAFQAQAMQDQLTGLFNRRYMSDALKAESERADRSGGRFCVLIFDIDHFKEINDRLGHLGGDNVLVTLSRTVSEQLRSVDRFIRYGGEEFLVLMPSTALSEALVGAERIRRCVESARITEAGEPIPVTVSIGIAEYRSGTTTKDMLAEADRALYEAKKSGRNCIRVAQVSIAAGAENSNPP